jgi:hypothetical protein
MIVQSDVLLLRSTCAILSMRSEVVVNGHYFFMLKTLTSYKSSGFDPIQTLPVDKK